MQSKKTGKGKTIKRLLKYVTKGYKFQLIVVLVSTTLAIRLVGVVIVIYAVLDIIARAIFIKEVQDYLDK